MDNKTGVTYKPSNNTYSQPLPTKNGYVQFAFRPIKTDMSWVAVNNISGKTG